MESLLVFVTGVQFLLQYLASNAVRPEACSEVYEYGSWMRGCHTDNLASSGLCPDTCLLASTILWTHAGLDIVHDSCSLYLESDCRGTIWCLYSLSQPFVEHELARIDFFLLD